MSGCKISRVFPSSDSWANIAKAIESGDNGYISLGDEISFELKDGTKITVQAAALDPYRENSVAFVMKDLTPWKKSMNGRNTNSGAYAASDMRRWITEEILPKFPDDLLAVIKPRTIRQVVGGREYLTEDKLWIPSRKELFGLDDTTEPDDVFFPLFATNKSRVKALPSGETYWYWLRSVYGDDYSRCVDDGGGGNYDFASYSYGVALSFII